jgi:uncharacterized protein
MCSEKGNIDLETSRSRLLSWRPLPPEFSAMSLSAALCLPILATVILTSCSTVAQSPAKIDVPGSTSATTMAISPLATGNPQSLPTTKKLVIGKRTILLEEANSPQEQTIGLMHRPSMPSDRGMLFNMPKAGPAKFWMKNTLIPLDIIFLRQGKIANIQFNVPPCKADPCPSYGPESNVFVDQVLELNGGQAKLLGLKQGDRLQFYPLQAKATTSPTPSLRKK